MLTEERQKIILDLLREKEIIKNRELIQLMNVSESTIRRDLQEMEEESLLQRVHGGARRIIKLEAEPTMIEKASKNIAEKKRIAKYAASLVKDGDYIYLDAGTTTFEMLPFLQGKACYVVTNSVDHAVKSVNLGLTTIIIGGEIREKTKATVSHSSVEQIKQYYFDKAFMGTNGIHPKYGYTTVDTYEALTKRVAMNQAQTVYVLADFEKFDKVNFSKIAAIDSATIITDKFLTQFKKELENQTIIKEVN